MHKTSEGATWAWAQFRHVDLGDPRRHRRIMSVAAQAARSPAGKVSEVFRSAASRQAAYDFLESKHVVPAAITRGLGVACAKSCASLPFAFLATDGSSLRVVDHARSKGFGSVSLRGEDGARGVKVVSVVALDPSGVPVGVAAQEYWARPVRAPCSRREQKRESHRRPDDEKETRFWLDAITHAAERFDEAGALGWFVVDREGDARPTLTRLASTRHYFTVRSKTDRALDRVEGLPPKLRARLATQLVFTTYDVDVPAAHRRRARRAHMEVRVLTTTLRMRIPDTRKAVLLPVSTVWAREAGTTPSGEKPLDWLLLTNFRVQTDDDAALVIYGYTTRWRIEEVHKAWKSGTCNVEDTQLRSHDAVVRWATLLFAVAARAERLKHLSRDKPDLPASVELSRFEIRALLLLKRRQKKRTETVPDAMPTLAQATRWLADLGGYTGTSSGGPPGAITIRRGLLDVLAAAEVLEQLENEAERAK